MSSKRKGQVESICIFVKIICGTHMQIEMWKQVKKDLHCNKTYFILRFNLEAIANDINTTITLVDCLHLFQDNDGAFVESRKRFRGWIESCCLTGEDFEKLLLLGYILRLLPNLTKSILSPFTVCYLRLQVLPHDIPTSHAQYFSVIFV